MNRPNPNDITKKLHMPLIAPAPFLRVCPHQKIRDKAGNGLGCFPFTVFLKVADIFQLGKGRRFVIT
jgi:hypothetical protein